MFISTARTEAFSDGIMAIILTVMVFDLKLTEIPSQITVWDNLLTMLPKFIGYTISFVVLAIMWVNHHQLFHQIKHTDRNLLWVNLLLLFWMSLIPFGTHLVGLNPEIPLSACIYAFIFFMNALSFSFLRDYVRKRNLLHEGISIEKQRRISRKNRLSMAVYLLAAVWSWLSVGIAYTLIVLVPCMYVIPEKIEDKMK